MFMVSQQMQVLSKNMLYSDRSTHIHECALKKDLLLRLLAQSVFYNRDTLHKVCMM